MKRIELRLLGAFECCSGGEPIELAGTRKMRALFAFLAMHSGQRLPRSRLGALLWGSTGDRLASNSLNQALYSLRKHLASNDWVLRSDRKYVWFAENSVETDVARFELLADECTANSLECALSLYRGQFLEDLDVNEEVFADWLRIERSRQEARAIEVGEHLLSLTYVQPNRSGAQQAQRLLTIDFCNETAHRYLMRFHAVQGRQQAASRQFEQCKEILHRELDVSPSQETSALAETIATGEIGRQKTHAGDIKTTRRTVNRYVIAGMVVVAIALGAVVFHFGSWSTRGGPPTISVARLVVMPFETAGRTGYDTTLARGLADEVTTELAKIQGLSVISRDSAERLAGANLARISENGITHLLRGRIRPQSESELVLHMWLLDVENDTQIWAERFTGATDDLHAFQSRVLSGAGTALLRELGEMGQAFGPDAVTEDAAAFDHYLQGLTALFKATPAGHAEAATAFERALDLDPRFDKARAGLAAVQFDVAFGPQDFAVALDTSWVEAYLRLKELLAAVTQDASAQAGILASRLALRRRDHQTATRLAKAAIVAAPGNAEAVEAYAEALIYSADFDKGEAHARQALMLNPATPSRPTFLLALAAFGRGDTDGAIRFGEEAAQLARYAPAEVLGLLSAAHGMTGDKRAARAYLDRYIAAYEERPRHVWRSVDLEFSNPRRTTWSRPNLATAVYAYPYSDRLVLDRLAKGFELAGISGTTLGYFQTERTERLDAAEIRELMFGATIEGRGIQTTAQTWRQTRSGDGKLEQLGLVGPLLLATHGASRIDGDQICDRRDRADKQIESCSSVFRIFNDKQAPIDGTYLLTTEFGPFVFSQIAE